jgi:hypothetical protein
MKYMLLVHRNEQALLLPSGLPCQCRLPWLDWAGNPKILNSMANTS